MRGVKVEDPTERAMRRAYTNQRARAKGRGIPFLFTFEQWRDWWLTNNRWALRGRGKNNHFDNVKVMPPPTGNSRGLETLGLTALTTFFASHNTRI